MAEWNEYLMNKILIFDDEEAIRMLYEIELAEDGYEVVCSEEASQCIELILEHRPNVVVMDKRMGKHDGLEVLRRIRNRFPDLPLVLCSAYASQGSRGNADVVDFHACKTSDMQDLKSKITLALGLRR